MPSPHQSKGHDNYHWSRGRGLKLWLILLVNCTHLSSNQLVCILSIQIKLTICPLFSLSIDKFLWKRENNNGAPHMHFLDYNLNWKKEHLMIPGSSKCTTGKRAPTTTSNEDHYTTSFTIIHHSRVSYYIKNNNLIYQTDLFQII